MIDLHLHTTASDGEFSPKELVDLCIEKGFSAIAITDHDTTAGIQEAVEYSEKIRDKRQIEVIPGIEIQCDEYDPDIRDIHVVGLFIDHKHEVIKQFIKTAGQARIDQKRKIINKLIEFGYEISFDEIMKTVDSSFGRPHIAAELVRKYPKEFKTIKDAFDKYIAVGKPAYVDRKNKVKIKEAIDLIRRAGGISFLGHPGVYRREASLKLIDVFKQAGGQGIETYYPYHIICPELGIDEAGNGEIIRFYQEVAKSKGLLEAGGSDFHGKFRDTLTALQIPDAVLENLRSRISA